MNPPQLTTATSNEIERLFKENGFEIEDHAKEIFDLVDEDKSGKIEIDEFLEVLRLRHANLTLKEIREQFRIIDGDGSNALEFPEFKILLSRCFEAGDSKNEIQAALSDVEALKAAKLDQ